MRFGLRRASHSGSWPPEWGWDSRELVQRIADALNADADELLLLADRIPEELAEVVMEKRELAPLLLRRWKAGAITDKQVEELLRKTEAE